MPYVVPAMPLKCNIWRVSGVGGTYASPDEPNVPCNLSPGRRTFKPQSVPSTTVGHLEMEMLLPALTDVRSNFNGIESDLVECPSGSKRFYDVTFVDDIGKGFANEHRLCLMVMILAGGSVFGFTLPVPLP